MDPYVFPAFRETERISSRCRLNNPRKHLRLSERIVVVLDALHKKRPISSAACAADSEPRNDLGVWSRGVSGQRHVQVGRAQGSFAFSTEAMRLEWTMPSSF